MSNKRKGNKYPSPEVYDHVRFNRSKVTLKKHKNIWYLAIAVAVLTVVLLIIITK